jgi:ABC-type uncharacterized transport system substrate-binding protein
MKRRDFIGAIYGTALGLPFATAAEQPGKVWRIGEVLGMTPERGAYLAQALEQGLTDLGYVQGRNIVLSRRFAAPHPDKVQEVIVSLLPQIDSLVAWGTIGGVAAKKLAGGVPTVFVGVGAPVDIKSADDLETAFATIKKSEVGALLPIAGVLTFTLDSEIADRALAAQFPLCSPFRDTAVAGELVSLGPDLVAMNRQAAAQVDKIIKGTSPADIPVEQPTRYELYINLNTARLLNLTVPPSLLARADDVIE